MLLRLVVRDSGFAGECWVNSVVSFYYFLCCLFDKLWCLFVLILVFWFTCCVSSAFVYALW